MKGAFVIRTVRSTSAHVRLAAAADFVASFPPASCVVEPFVTREDGTAQRVQAPLNQIVPVGGDNYVARTQIRRKAPRELRLFYFT